MSQWQSSIHPLQTAFLSPPTHFPIPVLSGRGHMSEIKNWGRKRITMDASNRKDTLPVEYVCSTQSWCVRSPDWSSCKAPSHRVFESTLLSKRKQKTAPPLAFLPWFSPSFLWYGLQMQILHILKMIFLYFCLHVCLSVFHVFIWCPVRPEDGGGG